MTEPADSWNPLPVVPQLQAAYRVRPDILGLAVHKSIQESPFSITCLLCMMFGAEMLGHVPLKILGVSGDCSRDAVPNLFGSIIGYIGYTALDLFWVDSWTSASNTRTPRGLTTIIFLGALVFGLLI